MSCFDRIAVCPTICSLEILKAQVLSTINLGGKAVRGMKVLRIFHLRLDDLRKGNASIKKSVCNKLISNRLITFL